MRTSPGLLVGSTLMAVLLVLFGVAPSSGQAPKAGASAAATKELSNESEDLVISGSGFTMATLQDNAVAFSNRGYIWQKVPASLRGKRYTKINGGARPPLKVKAKKDTIVEVITETSEAPGVKMDGWIRTGIRFTFNNGKNAVMVLFKKKAECGRGSGCSAGMLGGCDGAFAAVARAGDGMENAGTFEQGKEVDAWPIFRPI